MEWVYTAVAIWAFERISRIARQLLNGISSHADIKLYPGEVAKIKINYSHIWKPYPGSYIFIQFLNPLWGFWESHPFSCYQSPIPGEEDQLILCIKIRDGKTKDIQKLLHTKNGSHNIPVIIDGPYGQHYPVENSDNIVLFAGGIGVTAILSYALWLSRNHPNKKVCFVWVIRQYDMLFAFKDELNHLASDPNFNILIFATNESTEPPTIDDPSLVTPSHPCHTNSTVASPISATTTIFQDSKSREANGHEKTTEKAGPGVHSSSTSLVNSITYKWGRPPVEQIVQSNIEQASSSIAFMVCGPGSFNDRIRYQVTKNMHRGHGNVDLFVEAFN